MQNFTLNLVQVLIYYVFILITQLRSLMAANKKSRFHSIVDLDKGMRVWVKDKMPFVVGDTLK